MGPTEFQKIVLLGPHTFDQTVTSQANTILNKSTLNTMLNKFAYKLYFGYGALALQLLIEADEMLHTCTVCLIGASPTM